MDNLMIMQVMPVQETNIPTVSRKGSVLCTQCPYHAHVTFRGYKIRRSCDAHVKSKSCMAIRNKPLHKAAEDSPVGQILAGPLFLKA